MIVIFSNDNHDDCIPSSSRTSDSTHEHAFEYPNDHEASWLDRCDVHGHEQGRAICALSQTKMDDEMTSMGNNCSLWLMRGCHVFQHVSPHGCTEI
jgi:hypothetical protein